MTVAPATVKATEVRLGDRVRARSGAELTVTRIDEEFIGRANMLAFVEDSEEQWFQDTYAASLRPLERQGLAGRLAGLARGARSRRPGSSHGDSRLHRRAL